MKALKLFIFGFKAGQLLPPSTNTHSHTHHTHTHTYTHTHHKF